MLTLALAAVLAQGLPAAEAVKAADDAMNAADFHRALELLEQLDPRSAASHELERAALLRAECLITLQRPDEAEAAFADAVKLNPTVQLGPNAAAKLVAALDRVKARLVGTLALSSNVAGAMALVDGKRVGPLPISVSVVAGQHRIKIDSTDTAIAREVEVFAGELTQVTLQVTARQVREDLVVAPGPQRKEPGNALPIALTAVGGAAAVAGGILLATSFSWNSALGSITIAEAKAKHDAAELQHHLGLGALGVGAAAAVTGLAVLLWRSPEPTALVAPLADGAILGLAGSF